MLLANCASGAIGRAVDAIAVKSTTRVSSYTILLLDCSQVCFLMFVFTNE